jgi:hypothetical protein
MLTVLTLHGLVCSLLTMLGDSSEVKLFLVNILDGHPPAGATSLRTMH